VKRNFSLTVDNLHIPGEIYIPEKSRPPNPAICLCHGIPSGQPNPGDDPGYPGLAQLFSNAGFITAIFNFRGAHGTEGNLDMIGWVHDLTAVVNYLSGVKSIDKSRLCLLGSSAGAAVSVYVAANDPRISALATLACPAEFGFVTDARRVQGTIDQFRSIGLIRDAGFPPSVEDWAANFKKVAPIKWIEKISPRPLLLVHGDRDDLVPIEHAQRLFQKAGEPKKLIILPGAGHRLRHEEKAVSTALSWLKAVSTVTTDNRRY